MRYIPTVDAVGHILCHDITRIVRGEFKGVVFKKGHVVREEDIPMLLSVGKEHLYIYELVPGMVHEDDAATVMANIVAGDALRKSPVKEGKIDVFADQDGLFTVDVERLRQINRLGDLMIATRHTNSPVHAGDKLAGTRVIPLTIPETKLAEAQAIGGANPLIKLHPYRPRQTAIVVTGSEVEKGPIKDTFTPVVQDKLAALGIHDVPFVFVGDDVEREVAAIRAFLHDGVELVLCTGGMSVDPDDRTPLAIKTAAPQVVTYGSPVLPGAMFMLAYTDAGQAVMGLPGCVMFHGRTVFDIVLPRVLADIRVTADDIVALGHGGLCLDCPTCIFPNCALGSGC